MVSAPPARAIELDQDRRIESTTWVAERCGWAAMAALLLASFCGLFGGGPLSRAVAGDPRGEVQVAYERFGRLGRTMNLDVRGASLMANEVSISFPEEYARSLDLEILTAPIERVLVRESRRVYTLRIDVPAGTPWTVYLRLKPQRAGRIAGDLAVASGVPIRISHLVYP